ncbi:MAG: GxxExxY protein [Bacteroidales bacterium]|nr:GxxExxY protein [Bacteroidales bacterium]
MEPKNNDSGLLFKEESYKIIGAAMEVHRLLGCGFVEPVYQEALEKEFVLRGIPYEREKELSVSYKGSQLSKTFKADFVCYGKIILELKAVKEFADEHYAQIYNYLRASGLDLGLLINFGSASIEFERVPASNKWR